MSRLYSIKGGRFGDWSHLLYSYFSYIGERTWGRELQPLRQQPFENFTQKAEPINKLENSTQKAEPINKLENKTFEENGSNAQISKLGTEETNKVSIENHNSIEKDDWEKVLFDLRRVKFGKMVLGGLLRNVEIPKKIDDKLTLKFKSKHLHDLFKAEWKIDLAREAVRNAVIKVYGDKIKLVLEEPEDEKNNNIEEKNILDSSIVKSALAMGAKIEEEKGG